LSHDVDVDVDDDDDDDDDDDVVDDWKLKIGCARPTRLHDNNFIQILRL